MFNKEEHITIDVVKFSVIRLLFNIYIVTGSVKSKDEHAHLIQ